MGFGKAPRIRMDQDVGHGEGRQEPPLGLDDDLVGVRQEYSFLKAVRDMPDHCITAKFWKL